MKSALPNSSRAELYRAAWPFVWIICLGIVIIAIFPGIATWLPNLMGPRQ
jgi:TRAP-type C4-dicarboxylate transport system permease large subunit